MFTSLNQTAVEVSSLASSIDENSQETLMPSPKYRETAIVLNVNARSVTPNLCEIAEEVFGKEHVYITSTKEEARRAAATIVQHHQYSVVVPVGGDGTLSTLLDLMTKEIMKNSNTDVEQAVQQLPLVGYIPLGTGNGVGSVVKCQPMPGGIKSVLPGAKRRQKRHLRQVFEKLKEVARHDTSHNDAHGYEVVELPMMQVSFLGQQELCFFAGVGFDSLMLNDFKEIKKWSQRTGILKRTLGSVVGYCVALVVKTLPKTVWRGLHNINVTVTTNVPEETTWIDHRRGDVMRKVTPCGNLYQGMTGILAAGTSPFYGGGLRLFPFARMTLDKMHLRLGRIHPLTGFFNIPKIFEGSYRDTSDKFGCIDFVGSQFTVNVHGEDDEGFPFQHSGESVGHASSFQLQVVKEPVKFISFMQKSWKQ
jgi:diacylglycerol kinase family enzyme